MKRLYFVAFVVLTGLALSCGKKQEPAGLEFVGIPTAVKSTFYHKVGSYWIYQEANTGFVDCVLVSSATFDTIAVIHPGSKEPIASKESFSMKVRSSFYGNEVDVFSEVDYLKASFRPSEPHHWVTYQTRANQNVVVWATHLMTWPFTVNKAEPAFRFLGNSQIWRLDSILTNYTLSNQTYDTVWYTVTQLDLTRQSQEVHRHIALGIGEIRRNSVNQGIDWHLLRHFSQP
jgi:hypothetical protein